MGAAIAIVFYALIAVAFELWGPKLADATGWKWPRSRWRGLIGSFFVYLGFVGLAAIMVVALLVADQLR